VKHLGNNVEAVPSEGPVRFALDRIPTRRRAGFLVARFTCPEFTSLCPATGAPDFAVVVIDYVPDKWLCESKSLKLFLASFRNHGAFHEDCTSLIGKKLAATLKPQWLRVCSFFTPRGGIPIDVFWQRGKLPNHCYVPDPNVQLYLGRR
jgi:7-cyano-7-deazaguanine reductase